jgi:prepilin-type processing-associated H-X9-DG protein
MSILTPFGSVEIKGQFLDYAWVLVVLSILFLLLIFASKNTENLGIRPELLSKLSIAEGIIPFALFGFIVWAGANFEFLQRQRTLTALLGAGLTEYIHAGLDYGYWIAMVSVCSMLATLTIRGATIRQVITKSVVVLALAILVAFVMNRPTKRASTLAAGSAPIGNSPTPTAAGTEERSFDSSPYVALVSANARIYEKNYQAERFSDSLRILLKFKNITQKEITGIKGRVEVLDGFSKPVFAFNFRDDGKIPAGSEEIRADEYSFEHNQFEDDDPYSMMYPLISAGIAKYRVTVSNIAFADGSVLPAK